MRGDERQGRALSVFGQLPEGVPIVVDSAIPAGATTAILLDLLVDSRAVQRRHGTDDDGSAAFDSVRSAAPDVTMPVPGTGAAVDGDPFDPDGRQRTEV